MAGFTGNPQRRGFSAGKGVRADRKPLDIRAQALMGDVGALGGGADLP